MKELHYLWSSQLKISKISFLSVDIFSFYKLWKKSVNSDAQQINK
jgi:hypothetical protein